MVHALGIDSHLMNPHIENNEVKCNFNISNNNVVNLFEAYTESIANTCNNIVNALIFDKDPIILHKNELKFSLFQCSKILNFYNISNIDEFFCVDCCFPSNNNWIEKTSILAYFFLKTSVIYDINTFISKYMFNNTRCIFYTRDLIQILITKRC